ncbi:expressed protein [Phakopsora pachyrhizi]|uniref:Expressed protein n=1 Tax=Phakopsora pachyrhizi TaxID=170000 RepID=A0AAV0BT64_PHAPC|nr:expressed protein [Phakopsora pachyrhizi]
MVFSNSESHDLADLKIPLSENNKRMFRRFIYLPEPLFALTVSQTNLKDLKDRRWKHNRRNLPPATVVVPQFDPNQSSPTDLASPIFGSTQSIISSNLPVDNFYTPTPESIRSMSPYTSEIEPVYQKSFGPGSDRKSLTNNPESGAINPTIDQDSSIDSSQITPFDLGDSSLKKSLEAADKPSSDSKAPNPLGIALLVMILAVVASLPFLMISRDPRCAPLKKRILKVFRKTIQRPLKKVKATNPTVRGKGLMSENQIKIPVNIFRNPRLNDQGGTVRFADQVGITEDQNFGSATAVVGKNPLLDPREVPKEHILNFRPEDENLDLEEYDEISRKPIERKLTLQYRENSNVPARINRLNSSSSIVSLPTSQRPIIKSDGSLNSQLFSTINPEQKIIPLPDSKTLNSRPSFSIPLSRPHSQNFRSTNQQEIRELELSKITTDSIQLKY